jgi:hypothetical protein
MTESTLCGQARLFVQARFAIVYGHFQLTKRATTDSARLRLAKPILQLCRGAIDDRSVGSPSLRDIDGRSLSEAWRIGQLDNGIVHGLNGIRDLGLRDDRLTADHPRCDAQRYEHEFLHCVSPFLFIAGEKIVFAAFAASRVPHLAHHILRFTHA